MREINSRFNGASITSNLARAGVLIHEFDEFEDPYAKWMPCSDACEGFANPRERCRYCGLRDRMSVSLIGTHGTAHIFSAEWPNAFSFSGGGVVLNPAKAKLLCSYDHDASSRGKECIPAYGQGVCVPGCTMDGTWCDPHDPGHCGLHTPWRPQHLNAMLNTYAKRIQGHGISCKDCKMYNEVILDSRAWKNNMPATVDAFFYPVHAFCGDKCRARVKKAHSDFLRRYPGAHTPLLRLHLDRKSSPFEAV